MALVPSKSGLTAEGLVADVQVLKEGQTLYPFSHCSQQSCVVN